MNETTETLISDMSIENLQKLVSGEGIPAVEEPAPAPPAAEPKTPPAEPAKAEPEPVAAAAEPPAAEPEEKKPEAEGIPAEPKQEPPEPPKSGIDKRLSKLAQKRREAEALARTEHDRAEQLARELEALKAGQPGPKPPAAEPSSAPQPPATAKPKPQLKDFVAALDADKGEEYDLAVERFTDAITDWKEEQRAAQRQQQLQADAEKAQTSVLEKDWEEALNEHPDFEDAVERVRQATPVRLQEAISQLREDDGKKALWPAITMYLDENPDELTSLTQQFHVNQVAAIARLGRIASKLSAPPKGTPAPAPTTQTQAAPPKGKTPPAKPPAAVGGTATPTTVDINTVKDLDVVGRELKKMGLEIPGFGS